MNILGTQFTLNNRTFEIYLAGCNGQPKCEGCHNPESWDFNLGEPWVDTFVNKIYTKLTLFKIMIDSILVMGGEPLDQNLNELEDFLKVLNNFKIPIYLFTRYDLSEVPDFIKEQCDYIKCGRYIPELKTDYNFQYGINLATSNQVIYKKGIDY